MRNLGRSRPVSEHEADGEVERVFDEAREVLRSTGVPFCLQVWAGYPRFLAVMWDALRPNVETHAFELAADRVRAQSVWEAGALPREAPSDEVMLGPSQAYRLQNSLDLYHYLNPKLLVLTCAVRMCLEGTELRGTGGEGASEPIEAGAPEAMPPMETLPAESLDEPLENTLQDIRETLALSWVHPDFLSLALWPDYLESSWARLKPLARSGEFSRRCDALRELARAATPALPYRVTLSPSRLHEAHEDLGHLQDVTARLEHDLPVLILWASMLGLEWRPAEALERSPYPVAVRVGSGAWAGGGAA